MSMTQTWFFITNSAQDKYTLLALLSNFKKLVQF